MKKSTSAVLLTLFSCALIALILWSLADPEGLSNGSAASGSPSRKGKVSLSEDASERSKNSQGNVKKAQQKENAAPTKTETGKVLGEQEKSRGDEGSERDNQSKEKGSSKKESAQSSSDESAKDAENKNALTQVSFRTLLPNGKPFKMPVHVEQNGQSLGGPGILGYQTIFDLKPGEATAYCKLHSRFSNIGEGESRPVTFVVNGQKQQLVVLKLDEAPGYFIELKNSAPDNDAELFYDVVYDKSGQWTEEQAIAKAQLDVQRSSSTIIRLGVQEGLYYLVASSVPYRAELVKTIQVRNHLETRQFTLPKANTDNDWRFVKVTNSKGQAVTEASFTVQHQFETSTFRQSPRFKYLGQGLYKVNIPLADKTPQGYESSQLETQIGQAVVAITAFRLNQNQIDVSLEGEASIHFTMTMKGKSVENKARIALEGPKLETEFSYSAKKQVTGLIPGEYRLRVFLPQPRAFQYQKRSFLKVVAYEKRIIVREGKNTVTLPIEVYDRIIPTKSPDKIVIVFRKAIRKRFPWIARTDSEGRAQLVNLAPGDYQLKVKGSQEKIQFTVP